MKKRIDATAMETIGSVTAEKLTTNRTFPFFAVANDQRFNTTRFDQGDILQATLSVLSAVTLVEVL